MQVHGSYLGQPRMIIDRQRKTREMQQSGKCSKVGNVAKCFSVNAVLGLSNAAITCKHSTINGIFKCYNCGGQVYEAPNRWKSAMQSEGKSLVVEGIEEEGMTLIFDNTLQAPKEDMLLNAPVYDQYEEEVSYCIFPIEN